MLAVGNLFSDAAAIGGYPSPLVLAPCLRGLGLSEFQIGGAGDSVPFEEISPDAAISILKLCVELLPAQVPRSQSVGERSPLLPRQAHDVADEFPVERRQALDGGW